MRRHLLGLAIALVAFNGSSPLLAREDAKADQIMAESRKALGGEQKLSAIKGLSVRAEFRRELASPGGGATFVMVGGHGSMGGSSSQLSGSLEVDVIFPDKYYRQETTTGGIALTRIEGFEGSRPFMDIVARGLNTRVQTDRPGNDAERTAAALRRSHSELARLLLGMIAGTHAQMPATYTYAGQAESPDGTAHVIDVTAPNDFKARLFIDSATHLPLMLTFSELEPRAVRMNLQGGPGSGGVPRVVTPGTTGGGATKMTELRPEQRAELDKQMKEVEEAPRKTIEYRMFFADYRDVDGISLPHRISRATAEKTTEEWEIKSYKVNPSIKADRFKVGTE